MPIDFHAEHNRLCYASRQADETWREFIQGIVDVRGKQVVDIGCGGGIYTLALAEMGAAHVTGIDFSQETIKSAQERYRDDKRVSFVVDDALHISSPDQQYDIALQRAFVHHLQQNELLICFKEAKRILKHGGVFLVQDRTPEDCLLPGSETNIRGYFFSRYPKLAEIEAARRYKSEVILQALRQTGFQDIEERMLWETQRVYANVDDLAEDTLKRSGRSILHDLTDDELADLVSYIREQLRGREEQEIVESERWTVWSARKGD